MILVFEILLLMNIFNIVITIIPTYMKGVSLSKRQPAHFVSVFNKQQKEAKMLSR